MRPHLSAGVTVAIVVFNEEQNLERVLTSLRPPSVAWEVLVIDNGSTDGTRRAFQRHSEKNPSMPLRWIAHPSNNLGAARARAVLEARHAIVGFIDADCIAPKDWVEKSYHALLARETDPLALALGSGNYPPREKDIFYQALALQLSSPLGHLNAAQARIYFSRREVAHLPTCNIFYFRERLLRAGNFSPAFSAVCEDLDLSLRARRQGFRLLYEPGLEVEHAQKKGFLAWAAKMFRYGWGQVSVARAHPSHMLGIKAIPLLAALAAMGWALTRPVSFFFFLLFYLGATGAYSAGLCFARGRPRLTGHVFGLFLVTHIFYSLGELWGLLCQIKRWKVNQREGQQPRLPLEGAKE